MSTDAMYNAESRYLHQKFVIHFTTTKTLEVLQGTYLVSSSILEDSYKATDSPFGEVTSNELTLTLYDENGMFNPVNKQSPYFGMIKRGIKIEAFIRPDETEEWDPLGVFYVNDWTTSTSGMTADITANDSLYKVLNGAVPTMPIYRNRILSEFLVEYFSFFDCTVIVDKSLDIVIPFIYTSDHSSNKQFLTDLMLGAMADCFCDHTGTIRVVSKVNTGDVRAKLTDNDQIITASIKHTILNNYDSAVVTYHVGQDSKDTLLLSVNSIPVEVGTHSTGKLEFSTHPVLAVKAIKVISDQIVKPLSYVSNAKEFECTLQSSAEASISLDVTGTTLDFISSVLGTPLDVPLKLSSKFLQDKAIANAVYGYAKAYVEASTPTLELAVRGNPKLQLGDKIEVDSSYYRINYVGTIIGATYNYSGSLSCKLTLAMLGGA